MTKYKNIAITGANGLLGREAVRLLSETTQVTPIDIAPNNCNHSYHHADVSSIDALRSAFEGVDAVVHLAALQLNTPEEKIYGLNTIGTWNVLQVAKELKIKKVVLVSSECATGIITLSGARGALPEYLPVDEFHPLKPVDAYGCSKEANEALGRAFARATDMQVVVLRPTTVYGPGMEGDMRAARKIDDPYFWHYVDVRDVAEAIRLAVGFEGDSYDCFFVSAEDTFAPEKTLDFLERKYGSLPANINKDIYQNLPHACIYDTRRSREVLGLKISSNWRTYLNEA
jgi:UDP-glucose 4-epimerase